MGPSAVDVNGGITTAVVALPWSWKTRLLGDLHTCAGIRSVADFVREGDGAASASQTKSRPSRAGNITGPSRPCTFFQPVTLVASLAVRVQHRSEESIPKEQWTACPLSTSPRFQAQEGPLLFAAKRLLCSDSAWNEA